MTEPQVSLIHAFALDGSGGAVEHNLNGIHDLDPEQPHWLHFDFTSRDARQWIQKESGISSVVANALLDEDSRPRVLEEGEGVLVILRGVNHNPGEQLDDMVSVRLWIQGNRIVSTRRRRLLSVKAIADDLRAGTGPKSLSRLLVKLVVNLGERIEPVVDTVNDAIEQAELKFSEEGSAAYRGDFSLLRRQAVRIRRWLAPQRTALEALARIDVPLLSDGEKLQIREEVDQLTRLLEELDMVRERAMVAQEELIAQLAQEQNSRMYILSLIAAVFLPLSFVTGLMGMNVAGMPGTSDPRAFMLLLALMLFGGIGILLLFKWRKWM